MEEAIESIERMVPVHNQLCRPAQDSHRLLQLLQIFYLLQMFADADAIFIASKSETSGVACGAAQVCGTEQLDSKMGGGWIV
jgi:hypothetical protein